MDNVRFPGIPPKPPEDITFEIYVRRIVLQVQVIRVTVPDSDCSMCDARAKALEIARVSPWHDEKIGEPYTDSVKRV